MKFVDEFRDPDRAASPRPPHRRGRHAAVGPHGGLRRTDPFHRALRHRPHASPRGRARARPRLPGVRDVARDDRPRPRDIARRPDVIFTSFGDMLRVPGSHGDLLRLRGEGADVRVVYSPRSTPWRSPARTPIGTSSSSASASRPPRPPTPWPSSRRTGSTSRTSPCWSPTCSCRRPWPRSSTRRTIGCAASSARATCAPSWAFASTRRWPNVSRCRSSSPDSNRSTSSKASCAPCPSSRRGRRRSRTSMAGRSRAKATPPPAPWSRPCSRSPIRPGAASGSSPLRLPPARRLPGPRRAPALRRLRHCDARAGRLHQRSRPARRSQARRLPRVRSRVHAPVSARRHHGLERGRLCGLLPVRPSRRPLDAWSPSCPLKPASRPSAPAPSRAPIARASSSGTVRVGVSPPSSSNSSSCPPSPTRRSMRSTIKPSSTSRPVASP